MNQIEKVSIALQPSVYNTFRALNNTVALTLSEYVDNSVQSYLDNKERILERNPHHVFEVSIEVDQINNQIIIKDNQYIIRWFPYHYKNIIYYRYIYLYS